jgi:speckle-type POZ protein
MEQFNWYCHEFKIIRVNFQWNSQVSFIPGSGPASTDSWEGKYLKSPFFSSKETPGCQWKLTLIEENRRVIVGADYYKNQTRVNIDDPVLVKISLLNTSREKIYKHTRPSQKHLNYVKFDFISIENLIKSNCQQSDGSFTFGCKIFCQVKKESDPSQVVPRNRALGADLEGLLGGGQYSDVNFEIGCRQFPAHKNILASRSPAFATMFQFSFQQQLISDRVVVEDIEPDVFDEVLRFIYSGRLIPTETMRKMTGGLYAAAEKYQLDELNSQCESHCVRHMSPENCFHLLLHGDLLNPAEHMMEMARFFRRFSSEVMATDGWKKLKQENPILLCNIQEMLFRHV